MKIKPLLSTESLVILKETYFYNIHLNWNFVMKLSLIISSTYKINLTH